MSIELSFSARKVLRLLEKSARPLSAYEILAKLQSSGLRSPPTVYRALDNLARQGLAHRLESINAFVACRKPGACMSHGSGVSAFALCLVCGQAQEIGGSSLLKAVHERGMPFFAFVDKAVVEISGVCRACSRKGKKRN